MKTVRILGRVLVPASLVLLAACQSLPGTKGTTAQSAPATTQPQTTTQAASQGAAVSVFLADTVSKAGWTPVNIQSGTLYVNPQPVISRDDLTGVKAGTNKQGEGLLALTLSDAGKKKITEVTGKNPNKRLALVVGRTMLAAPAYTTAVKTDQLVFAVGSEQNASAAARAIAGVSETAPPATNPAAAKPAQ